jgi:hypothetical protein
MTPAAERESQVSIESIKSDEGMLLEWRGGGIDVRTRTRALRYRLGPASATDAPTFPATAACGKEPYPTHVEDRFSVYTSYDVKGDRVASTILCHCSAKGCARSTTTSIGSVLAATEEGALLMSSTNSYQSETVVELRVPGKAPTLRKLAGGCIHGSFGPNGHAFVACELDERTEIVELEPPALKVLSRRAAPPGGRVNGMLRVEYGVMALGADSRGWFGATLGKDWFSGDQPMLDTPMVYAWPTFGIAQSAEGTLQIAGDADAAALAIRCFDGSKLRPFTDCRGAALGGR